mmetsp:Transcript_49130/g.59546  ORF Transcript_49130/g.59546 Transcript_49130/m.59546 type:complete len:228 (+) Transcript_49130:79-762(+)
MMTKLPTPPSSTRTFATSLLATVAVCCIVVTSSYQLRVCNRGFCFTKNHNNPTRQQQQQDPKRTGLDYCTNGEGHVMDCELLEILGVEDFEGVAGTTTDYISHEEQRVVRRKHEDMSLDSSDLLDESSVGNNVRHVPWKNKPKKGKCVDYDLSYTFDCNLIDILEEGLILIEDLRSGGIFATQPKSGFTTRPQSYTEPIKTPDVMQGSVVNPLTDFRTNAILNLEGL